MTESPTDMAIEAAKQLEGTGKSIAELGEEYEALELNSEFCAKLDELVFCCTVCDNWYEQSEMSEDHDWICNQCAIPIENE